MKTTTQIVLGIVLAFVVFTGCACAQQRPSLGIYLENGAGALLIDEVKSGSVADRAGLRAGDLLVSWNGKNIEGDPDLVRFLAATKLGDAVKIGVMRDKKFETVEAQFGRAAGAAAAPRGGGSVQESLERALAALDGDPGIGDIARARVLIRKALKDLAREDVVAEEPVVVDEEVVDEEMPGMPDFSQISARLSELLGEGKTPEEVQKIIAEEFPGVQVQIGGAPGEMSEEEIEEVPMPEVPDPSPGKKPDSRPVKKSEPRPVKTPDSRPTKKG